MGMYYGYVRPSAKKQPKRAGSVLNTIPTNRRVEEARRLREKYPSVGDGVGNALIAQQERYDDEELAERDAVARQVKHTVAPLYNKGGYQLITGDDIKTAGRKV